MLAYEQAELDLKEAEKNMETAFAQVSTQQAGLLGEKSRLEHLQEKLMLERHVSQSQILPENLSMYNHLRAQKRGLAVAAIEDGSCQACGSSLRPAELQTAKSPNKITFCSSCGRIIYAG
jgi:uncharacterized protein